MLVINNKVNDNSYLVLNNAVFVFLGASFTFLLQHMNTTIFYTLSGHENSSAVYAAN